jgi:ribose transport system substrate-binding protein
MKRLVLVPLVIFLGCCFSGCGKSEPNKKTIGLSVMTMKNPFFKVIADTMKEEAAKHGYDVIIMSGENDVAKQSDQVKDFIVKKVDAIVLCPCDPKGIGPAIKEANKAGIPVFTADTGCLDTDAKVVCNIATDNLEGGKEAGRAMIEALGDAGGKVLILNFDSAESCRLRVQGFKEVVGPHKKIEIVAERSGEGHRDTGYRMTTDTLKSHKDLAGIFAINDPSAIGAYDALKDAGLEGQIKIVGFDGQPEGKKAIDEGKLYADPIQFPDEIARKTVDAMLRYFRGEDVPAKIVIPTKLYRKGDAAKAT